MAEAINILRILRKGDSFEPLTLNLGQGQEATVTVLVLPGASADVRIAAELTGAGANFRMSGLYLSGADEKVNIVTEIKHLVPETSSNQLVNGIAGGKSHANFYGRIVVAQDAQKTEAYQTNHNILLSEGAKVDTKPQLEIYADDVKCSHGATIGRLDEQEQFYMRSRGIPEEEAKFLQLVSFLSPVLEAVPEDRKEELAALVEESLRSIL